MKYHLLSFAVASLVCLALPPASPAFFPRHAQPFPHQWYPQQQLLDQMQLIVRDSEILAVGSATAAVLRQRRIAGEEIIWQGASGGVALVITDRRLLSVTSRSADWTETRLRVHEVHPAEAMLGSRVAGTASDKRLFGIDLSRGVLVTHELGANEEILGSRVGENLLVFVTDAHVIGLSGFASGFFSRSIGVREEVESIAVSGDFATVVTSRRLLIFEARTGNWLEQNLTLR